MDVKFLYRISELPSEIKSCLGEGDTRITIADSALLDKPAQEILSAISKEWQKEEYWDVHGDDKNEQRTAKILHKVAKNIQATKTNMLVGLHLSTLKNEKVCDEQSAMFSESILDEGTDLQLLFGGKIYQDGTYSQTAGFSFISPLHKNSRISSYTGCFEPTKAFIKAIFKEIDKAGNVVGDSGTIYMDRFASCVWSAFGALKDYEPYFRSEVCQSIESAVEIQKQLNSKEYFVIAPNTDNTKQEQELFEQCNVDIEKLSMLNTDIKKWIKELKRGEIVARSTRWYQVPFMHIEFEVYDEYCWIDIFPDEDKFIAYCSSLPETSNLKYLSKLF